MGGKSGAKAAQREAERARAEEEARQQRVRQGTKSINRIFDGGSFGSGKATTFDPSETYFNADGTKWTPTPGPETVAAPRGADPASRLAQMQISGNGGTPGASRNAGLSRMAQIHAQERGGFGGMFRSPGAATLEQQFAQANAGGGLYTGTEQRGGFNDEFYRGIRDSFTNYAMPQLSQQRDDASKELTFALDRSGQLAGSVRGQKAGELQRLFDTNEQQVRDQALAYENQSRTSVENARADLIGMLNATGDNQQAVNSALSRSTILTQPQAYSPLGQLFTDFTAGLGAQAAQERAAAASGGLYKSRYDTGLFGGAGRVVNKT